MIQLLRVSDVVDDKHRGLVAQIAGDRAAAGDEAVSAVLGDFIPQWEWSGAEAGA
jgi:hypothetical protein